MTDTRSRAPASERVANVDPAPGNGTAAIPRRPRPHASSLRHALCRPTSLPPSTSYSGLLGMAGPYRSSAATPARTPQQRATRRAPTRGLDAVQPQSARLRSTTAVAARFRRTIYDPASASLFADAGGAFFPFRGDARNVRGDGAPAAVL